MWQPPPGTKSAKRTNKPRGATTRGWTCPRCKRTFRNKSQAHSCATITVAQWFVGRPAARRLYDAIRALVRKHGGPFREHAQKTRIAFVADMSFASVQGKGEWLDLVLGFPHKVIHTRLRPDMVTPTWNTYKVRIRRASDLEGLEDLVAHSYEMGLR